MALQSLVISRSKTDIPTCSPNLMPFHIDYNGPAPVSTFMRVEKLKVEEKKETKEDTTKPNTPNTSSTDVEMKLDASQEPTEELSSDRKRHTQSTHSPSKPTVLAKTDSKTTLATSESQVASGSATPSPSSTTVIMDATPPLLEDADKRFVSTFRGRTIHGLTIDLLTGYSGLILQSKLSDNEQETSKDLGVKTKGKVPSSSAKSSTRRKGKDEELEPETTTTRPRRGRLTRSAAVAPNPTKPIDIADEDTVMEEATKVVEDKTVPTSTPESQDAVADAVRRLVPSAQFSSFTLWQPDRVVDKNRDEYYRSLTEWISLANEIHGVDFD